MRIYTIYDENKVIEYSEAAACLTPQLFFFYTHINNTRTRVHAPHKYFFVIFKSFFFFEKADEKKGQNPITIRNIKF
jgi:hypothetical protein